MGFYAKRKKTATSAELQDILDQIMSKTERLGEADNMPNIDMPKTDDIGNLSRIGNLLSTGQKVTAKTARDLIMEGQLPTMQEYKEVADVNKEYSYRELLKELGMQDNFGTKALGLGLDIFADPTNLIPLSAVGKVIGKGSKLAEAIPLIGKGFKAVNKTAGRASDIMKGLRNIEPFESQAMNDIWRKLNGVTSREATISKKLYTKYEDMFKTAESLPEDKWRLITEGLERGADSQEFKVLAKPDQDFIKRLNEYFKETGASKESMGVVKGLIGKKPQSTLHDIVAKKADFVDNPQLNEYGFANIPNSDIQIHGKPLDITQYPEVYHVTTNAPAVEKSGFIKVGAGSGGLGGHNAGAVSFTVDAKVAQQIQDDLKLSINAENISKDVGRQEAKQFIFDQSPPELQKFMNSVLGDGVVINKDYSASDVLRAYFQGREKLMGINNPIMIGSEGLAGKNPNDVKILKINTSQLNPEVLSTNFDIGQGGLEEARYYGNVPLTPSSSHVAQAPLKDIEQLKMFGDKNLYDKDLFVDNVSEAVEYAPHIMTKEFREHLFNMSPDPIERQKVMAGMLRKYLPSTEKKRTFMGTIAAANDAAREKLGFNVFEENPAKFLPSYQMAYAKRSAMWDVQQDILKITGDDGLPLIKPIAGETTSEGMVKINGIPYKGNYETTPELAKLINRVNGVLSSDEFTNKFLKGYDAVLKAFKTSVTMPWPSFNANNLMGAMFNNFIYDAKTLADFPSTLMGSLFKKPTMLRPKNGVAMTMKEFSDEMAKRGGLNTFFGIETASGKIDKALSKVKALKPVQMYAGLPNNIETLVRLNLGRTVYEKTGSLEKAAKAIWEVHGNYSPEFLPKFEKEVMARVFPFWRWMRTSIPFQLENLYNKTGKYAAIAKAQNAVVSQEDRKNMPDYMKNQLLISKSEKDGKVSTQSWQAPFMDLQKLMSAREMASGMSPLLKVPAELTFNKELFTDKEIEDKSLPPEMRKNILSKNDPLGMTPFAETVQKKNKVTDEWEDRKQVNAKLAYILKNLGPISSLAAAGKRSSKELEAQGIDTDAVNKIAAIMKGVASPIKTQNYSKEEQEYYQAQALNAKLQEIINYLLQRNLIERKK